MSPALSLIVLVAGLLLPTTAWAQTIDIGPKVGAKISEPVGLRDAAGVPRTFADITDDRGVVLVFTRSAAWCPYCQAQMKELQSLVEPLARKGFRLVVITYDRPEVLARFGSANRLTYPLLSDEGSIVIDAFGIRDPGYRAGSKAFGVPKPAIFVVDHGGVVRAKLAEHGYRTRPTLAAIMAAVDMAAPSH